MTAQVKFGRPSGNYQLASNWQPPISNSITQELNIPYQQTIYQPAYVQPQTQSIYVQPQPQSVYVQPQPQLGNDGRYTLINTANNGLPGYASNYRAVNQPINRTTNSTVAVVPQQTSIRQPEFVQQIKRADYTKIYQTNLPNKKLGPDTDPVIKSSCCTPWWWLLIAILALIALVLALLFGLGVFGVNKPVDNSTNAGTTSIITPPPVSPNLNSGNPTPPTGTTSVSPIISTTKAPDDVYKQPQTTDTPASVPPTVVQPIRSSSDPVIAPNSNAAHSTS